MNNCKSSVSQWGIVVLLSMLWGTSFLFTEIAITELPIITIVFFRVFIASIVLLTLGYLLGVNLPSKKQIWKEFVGLSLLNNIIPFILIVSGQCYISSSLASILHATTPLFTVLIAHIFTNDEKISSQKVVGVVIGFLGVSIMIGYENLGHLTDGSIGQLAVLGAAFSYACAAIYSRRFKTKSINPLSSATGQVVISTIILLPIMIYIDHPFSLPMPSITTLAAVVGVSIFSTAVPSILYLWLIGQTGATNANLTTLLIPVSAIFFGIIFLNETLEIKHIIGMVCIVSGFLFVQNKVRF